MEFVLRPDAPAGAAPDAGVLVTYRSQAGSLKVGPRFCTLEPTRPLMLFPRLLAPGVDP